MSQSSHLRVSRVRPADSEFACSNPCMYDVIPASAALIDNLHSIMLLDMQEKAGTEFVRYQRS